MAFILKRLLAEEVGEWGNKHCMIVYMHCGETKQKWNIIYSDEANLATI